MGSEGGEAENLEAQYTPFQEFTWGAFLLLMGKKNLSAKQENKSQRARGRKRGPPVLEKCKQGCGDRGADCGSAGRPRDGKERGSEGAGNKAPRPASRPRGGTLFAPREPGGRVGVQVCGCGCARSEPLPPPPPKPGGGRPSAHPPGAALTRAGIEGDHEHGHHLVLLHVAQLQAPGLQQHLSGAQLLGLPPPGRLRDRPAAPAAAPAPASSLQLRGLRRGDGGALGPAQQRRRVSPLHHGEARRSRGLRGAGAGAGCGHSPRRAGPPHRPRPHLPRAAPPAPVGAPIQREKASSPPAWPTCAPGLASRMHVYARVQETSGGMDAHPPGSVHLRGAEGPSHLGSRRITVPARIFISHHYFCGSPGHMDRDRNVLHNPGSVAETSAGLGSEAEEAATAVPMLFGLWPRPLELWALVFGLK